MRVTLSVEQCLLLHGQHIRQYMYMLRKWHVVQPGAQSLQVFAALLNAPCNILLGCLPFR